jgi:hypothetical protein
MFRWDDTKDKIENIQINVAGYLASPDFKETNRRVVQEILEQINSIKKIEKELAEILDVFVITEAEKKQLASSSNSKKEKLLAEKLRQQEDAHDPIIDKKAQWLGARYDLFNYLNSEQIQLRFANDNSLLAEVIKKANTKPQTAATKSPPASPPQVVKAQVAPEPLREIVLAKPKTDAELLAAGYVNRGQLYWNDNEDRAINLGVNLERYLREDNIPARHKEIASKALDFIHAMEIIAVKSESLKQDLAIYNIQSIEQRLAKYEILKGNFSAEERAEHQTIYNGFFEQKLKHDQLQGQLRQLIFSQKELRFALLEYINSPEVLEHFAEDDKTILAEVINAIKDKPEAKAVTDNADEQEHFLIPEISKNEATNFSLDDEFEQNQLKESPRAIIHAVKKNTEHVTAQNDKTTLENFKENINRYLNEYAKKRHADPVHLRYANWANKKIAALEQIADKSSLIYYLELKEFIADLNTIKLEERGLLGRSFLYKLLDHTRPLLQTELQVQSDSIENAIKHSNRLQGIELQKLSAEANLQSAKISLGHQLQLAEESQTKLVAENSKLKAELAQEKLRSAWLRNAYNHLVGVLNRLFGLFKKEPLDLRIEKTHSKEDATRRVTSAVQSIDALENEIAGSENKSTYSAKHFK